MNELFQVRETNITKVSESDIKILPTLKNAYK